MIGMLIRHPGTAVAAAAVALLLTDPALSHTGLLDNALTNGDCDTGNLAP